jgi:arginine-tRNA-protein transferase
VLEQGLSAVYTFFDPAQTKRSLGGYAILWQIKMAQDLGLPYLFLGYWIKECQKMEYKSNYRPLQLLVDGRWVAVN